MILAILASLLFWPLYILASLALDLLGLVLIGAMVAWGRVAIRRSIIWPTRAITVWRGGWLTWLWGNEEDGVDGPVWWRTRTGVGPRSGLGARYPLAAHWQVAWSNFRWSALRNPSNNMRFIPGINPVIVPSRVRYWARPDFWFVWQGPFAGLWWWFTFRGQIFRVLVGWKLKPQDVHGVALADIRAPRCGFGVQLKRVSP